MDMPRCGNCSHYTKFAYNDSLDGNDGYIRKGQKHPDYDFDTENKRKCYDYLYKVCPNGMKLALTFPNYSNFRMEWELKEKYPELKINCFESDKKDQQRNDC